METCRITVAVAITAICSAVGLRALATDDQTANDPVRAVLRSGGEDSPQTSKLLRMTRDYNNDGLQDIAIGFDESCGNKTCSFALFLQTRDGHYKRVGNIGGLPFGYRLVPLSPGRVRWETCSASGQEVRYGSLVISVEGIEEESG